MQPTSRRPPPPWDRGSAQPKHPTGRARRRWPVAYDGGGAPVPRVNVRYRRAYDGSAERRIAAGPRVRRRGSTMDKLRRHPIRHGLIGLTIAGAGVPVAIARQQTPDRVNPAHEQIMGFTSGSKLTDSAVARVWADAVDEGATGAAASKSTSAAQKRESTITRNIERYAEYDVPRDLAENIYDLALQSDIDPDLAFGLVRAESAFKNSATSHVGAVGLTQLMPSTAKWLKPGVTRSDLRDPKVNLDIGFRYLRELIDKYDGNENLALLAYNRGPGTVDRVLKRGGDPNNGYVGMVKKYLGE
jgi:hypothetical protein